MHLFELTFPPTRQDAHDILTDAGYDRIGKGAFAFVYKNRLQTKKYVLKLFSATDKAYIAFISLCKQHSNNPHFPKIFGKLIRITPDYYAVRLEPLQKITVGSIFYHTVTLTRIYVTTINMNLPDISKYNQFYYDEAKKSREYMNNNPTLKEACDLIGSLIPPYKVDINRDNVMLRDVNTMVFSDPVYDPLSDEANQ